MMKEHLQKLLASEIWANELLAQTLEQATEKDERALFLFSHLLNSYSMWMSRIMATDFVTKPFEERSLEEGIVFMKTVLGSWEKYLNEVTEEELNRVVHFTFVIDGSKKKMTVRDAVLHLVLHSCYHRGQIMARLKPLVTSLPLTSYIAFAMEEDN